MSITAAPRDSASVPDAVAVAQGRPAFGSSFYLAMRILPRPQREAMFAVYAFCRMVDDLADEPGPIPERRAALARWRQDVQDLYAGKPAGQAEFLREAVQCYGLRREDFLAVIEGMTWDLAPDVRIADDDALDTYCDLVASAVGRLSGPIFGLPHDTGIDLAHHLGRALQLTNILRDLDEDAAIGRLYLPLTRLGAAGIDGADIAAALRHPALPGVCEDLLARASHHFKAAERIMASRPARETRAPRLMAMAYQSVHAALGQRGFAPPRDRVRVPKARLLAGALRLWLAR